MRYRSAVFASSILIVGALFVGACGSPDEMAGGEGDDPVVTDPTPPAEPTTPDECGEFTPEGQDPDDPDGVVGYAPCPGDDDGQLPQPGENAQTVVPQPGMENVRSRSFEMAKAGRGNKLRVFFWSGVEPCYVLDRVEVEETNRKVTVTLFEGSAPADDDEPVACIEIAVYKKVIAELDRPLGDRQVVDGAPDE